MYEISIKKDGKEIVSFETENCMISEKRNIFPLYQKGNLDPVAMVPSADIHFKIIGTRKADELNSEYYTID